MKLSICLSVSLFSFEHLAPIFFFLLLGAISIYIANRHLNDKGQRILGASIGAIALLGVLLRATYLMSVGEFSIEEELPIHLCRILAIAAPFALYSRNKKVLGVLYFAIYAGTLNANLTPDVDAAYPELKYFAYWMMHSVLLVVPWYAISVYKFKINWKDFVNAFYFLNLYFVGITLINWLLGSNYFYTCYKPVSGSLLDHFGEWPMYVIVTYLLGLLLMFILYFPWWIKNRTTQNRGA